MSTKTVVATYVELLTTLTQLLEKQPLIGTAVEASARIRSTDDASVDDIQFSKDISRLRILLGKITSQDDIKTVLRIIRWAVKGISAEHAEAKNE